MILRRDLEIDFFRRVLDIGFLDDVRSKRSWVMCVQYDISF